MTFWQYLDRMAERRAGRPLSRRLTFRDWLGAFLIFAFTSALFNLFFHNFPDKNEQLIVYMLGQLSGFVGAVVALHYNANRHDDQRVDDAANMAKAVRDVASAARTTAVTAASGPTGSPGDPVHTVEEKK